MDYFNLKLNFDTFKIMKKFYLLIYSKFSSHSKDLINLLSSLPDINLNFLSIDNAKTRKRILNDKSLNITKVPTLLIVSELTGVLQKFEGNQAFVYFHTVLSPPPPPVTTQPDYQQEEQQQQTSSSVNDNNPPNHTIIDPENHTVIEQDDYIDNLIDDQVDNVSSFEMEEKPKDKKDEKKVSLIAQATAMQKLRLQEDEMMKKTKTR